MDVNMKIKLKIVKKHIDTLDYYGLLAGGAPSDEFENEARAIANKISDNCTTEEIAIVIAQVFAKAFGNKENIEDYMNTAIDIKNDLIRL